MGIFSTSLLGGGGISHGPGTEQAHKKEKNEKKKKVVGVKEEEGGNKINLKGLMNVTQK